VSQHLPLLGQAVAILWRRFSRLRLVLPTLSALAPLVKQMVADWRVPVLVLEDRAERFDAYAASCLAIAASGTVSLEAALAGLPLITIYRTGPVTAWVARRLIKVPHVNLVNLILGRPAVPELLQEDCHPERIAATATRLLEDDDLRAGQQAALAEAMARLGATDGRPPSQCAAARVLEVMATTYNGRTA
jgi:lipid-A-disaccharide synthase